MIPCEVPETQNSQIQSSQDETGLPDDASSRTASVPSTPSTPSTPVGSKRKRLSQPFTEDESDEVLTPFVGSAKKKKKFPTLEQVESAENSQEKPNLETVFDSDRPRYMELLEKWKADPPELDVDIARITMPGNLREVTQAGVEMMAASFEALGIVPTEKFILRKLPPDDKTLGKIA